MQLQPNSSAKQTSLQLKQADFALGAFWCSSFEDSLSIYQATIGKGSCNRHQTTNQTCGCNLLTAFANPANSTETQLLYQQTIELCHRAEILGPAAIQLHDATSATKAQQAVLESWVLTNTNPKAWNPKERCP